MTTGAGNFRKWTDAEFEMLKVMKRAGALWPEIGRKLGRRADACRSKHEYMTLTELQREQRRQGLRRRRIAEGIQSTRLHPNGQIVASSRPALALLNDRDFRLSLPLTVTAALLGDPPPGYSALDRKLSGVGA